MTLVLVDTSVWIRQQQDSVARLLTVALEADAVAIVAPITLELLRGARDSRALRREAIRYDSLRQIELGAAIADRAREVQTELVDRGYHRGASPTDLLAAAAAESVGGELWHCDRHFELIAGVTGQRERRLGT